MVALLLSSCASVERRGNETNQYGGYSQRSCGQGGCFVYVFDDRGDVVCSVRVPGQIDPDQITCKYQGQQ